MALTMDENSTSSKWIVGLQQHPPCSSRSIGTIVKVNDPGTGDLRDYLLSSIDGNDSYIAEFQSIPEDFSSFIVGRHVIKDGDLYVINQIDPLFFYLATQSCGERNKGGTNGENNEQHQHKKQSWQPYDQFLEQSKLPREITKVITEEQIQHICLTFNNDELYFKFDIGKTLNWLQKKQERVLKALITQHHRKRNASAKATTARKNSQDGGSISSNFNFGNPVAPRIQESKKTSQSDNTNALKMESFQIICNYLNEAWSKKFVEHLGFSMEQVMNDSKTTHKSSIDSTRNDNKTNEKEKNTKDSLVIKSATNQKVFAVARTVGNKRLAKVSTKGMKSIGSFFGAGNAKKAKR